jgi:hypothetical protein
LAGVTVGDVEAARLRRRPVFAEGVVFSLIDNRTALPEQDVELSKNAMDDF